MTTALSELSADTLEIVEVMGVKLPIDPREMSDYLQDVIRAGQYEAGEAMNLSQLVEPGERLLELGAGIGFLSTVVWRLGTAETIVAVEANPGLIPLIRATHAMNGVTAEVINAAVVGEKTSETVSFSLSRDFWASSLTPRKRKQIREVVQIAAVALSDLVRAHAPTMLIIDVEGSEVELLTRPEGLAGVRKVLIEIHDNSIGPAGVKRVFDLFSAHGFYVDMRRTKGRVVMFRRLEPPQPI